jgi:hypothetical protein
MYIVMYISSEGANRESVLLFVGNTIMRFVANSYSGSHLSFSPTSKMAYCYDFGNRYSNFLLYGLLSSNVILTEYMVMHYPCHLYS